MMDGAMSTAATFGTVSGKSYAHSSTTNLWKGSSPRPMGDRADRLSTDFAAL